MTQTFPAWLNEAKGTQSGSALAKAVGVSQSQVSRWLTGKGYPAESKVDGLRAALGIDDAAMAKAMRLPLTNGDKPKATLNRSGGKGIRIVTPAVETSDEPLFPTDRAKALEELAMLALTPMYSASEFNPRLVRVGELVKILA